MRRGRRSMQGKLVHVEQRSNTAQSDCDGAVKQQYRLQQEQTDNEGDGDSEDDGSEKMVGVVERDERDVEHSTMMANGSRMVRMMDVDSVVGGDTAAMGGEAQTMEAESLDPLVKEARMKARLLDKRREKMEMERERVAEINKTNNGVESENTVQLRAKLKAGKKKRQHQEHEGEKESESTKQPRLSEEADRSVRERGRKSRGSRHKR